MSIQYCTKCLNPSTRPNLHFSEQGVCSACLNFDNRATVDWDERATRFKKIVEQYRNKTQDNYDCVVGVSGGKDSSYQIITLLRMGLKPLAVTGVNCALSELGRKNLNNLNKVGVDRIEVSTSKPVRSAMNRHALRTVGDISWPEHASIFSAPLRVSTQLGIPLQIWGENPANEYGGPASAEATDTLTGEWLSTFSTLNGLSAHDFIGIDGITKQDILTFLPPSYTAMQQTSVTGLFLGYYFPWDGLRNAIIAQAYGMEFYPTTIEGSMVNYENLDNYHTGIHDYFMFLKFGFGRATTLANMFIRRNRLSREEGLAIVTKHDGKFPATCLGLSLKDILEDIDLCEDEFTAICDKFTNRNIFKTDSQGKLVKNKDGSPQKITCS